MISRSEHMAVVALDLDNTCVVTEEMALGEAWRYFNDTVAPDLGLPRLGDLQTFIADHPGMTFRGIVATNCGKHGIEIAEEQLASYALGEMTRIIGHFEQSGLKPTPGTPELLHFLTEGGVPHPIVTSSAQKRAEVTVQSAGLGSFYEAERIFSAQGGSYQGAPKPDPGIYNYAYQHYAPTAVRLAVEDSSTGGRSAIASGAVLIGNVGALEVCGEKIERAHKLLDLGASIVVNDNESLIALVQHLHGYQAPYSREGVESYLKKGKFLQAYLVSESRAGRQVWLSERLDG